MNNKDILVIGIPKSGTNACVKACRLLGLNPSEHMHTSNYHLSEDNRVAYVYRNPRNVLISALRYRNHQRRNWEDTITEEKLIEVFFDFFNAGLPAVYQSYLPWLSTTACSFKFEDMIADKKVMCKIADYMDVPHPSCDTFAKLWGDTPTFTGELSDWSQYWTSGLDKIWVEEGMNAIEMEFGY